MAVVSAERLKPFAMAKAMIGRELLQTAFSLSLPHQYDWEGWTERGVNSGGNPSDLSSHARSDCWQTDGSSACCKIRHQESEDAVERVNAFADVMGSSEQPMYKEPPGGSLFGRQELAPPEDAASQLMSPLVPQRHQPLQHEDSEMLRAQLSASQNDIPSTQSQITEDDIIQSVLTQRHQALQRADREIQSAQTLVSQDEIPSTQRQIIENETTQSVRDITSNTRTAQPSPGCLPQLFTEHQQGNTENVIDEGPLPAHDAESRHCVSRDSLARNIPPSLGCPIQGQNCTSNEPNIVLPAERTEAGSYISSEAVSDLINGRDCTICLRPLLGKAVVITSCGHAFHWSCLSRARGTLCPQCRQPIDDSPAFPEPESTTDGFDDPIETWMFIEDFLLDMPFLQAMSFGVRPPMQPLVYPGFGAQPHVPRRRRGNVAPFRYAPELLPIVPGQYRSRHNMPSMLPLTIPQQQSRTIGQQPHLRRAGPTLGTFGLHFGRR